MSYRRSASSRRASAGPRSPPRSPRRSPQRSPERSPELEQTDVPWKVLFLLVMTNSKGKVEVLQIYENATTENEIWSILGETWGTSNHPLTDNFPEWAEELEGLPYRTGDAGQILKKRVMAMNKEKKYTVLQVVKLGKDVPRYDAQHPEFYAE